MADDGSEIIGGVGVTVTGDYSDLADSFTAAQADAQAAGESIAEAFNTGAEGADAITNSSAQAAAGLSDLSDASGYYASQADELSSAAQAAADAEAKAGEEARKAAEEAKNAGGAFKEFGETLLELTGITLTVEGLKELASGAINVYAATEKAETALAAITGSAAGAAESIDELKQRALQLAVPFEDLLRTQVRLTNYGLSIDQIRYAIQAAADGAAGSATDFGTAENALERIAQQGTLSGRVLRPLGLQMSDVAAAMHVSLDEVKKDFSDASVTMQDRALIIENAIAGKQGLSGLAETMATQTAGALQNFKTSWELTMDDIGKAISPAVTEWLPKLSGAMKDVVSAGVLVITGLNEVVGSIVGLMSAGAQAAITSATVWGDAFSGHFIKAAQDAKAGYESIKSAGKFTWDSMVSDAQAGYDTLDRLFAQHAKLADIPKPQAYPGFNRAEVDDDTEAVDRNAGALRAARQAAKEYAAESKQMYDDWQAAKKAAVSADGSLLGTAAPLPDMWEGVGKAIDGAAKMMKQFETETAKEGQAALLAGDDVAQLVSGLNLKDIHTALSDAEKSTKDWTTELKSAQSQAQQLANSISQGLAGVIDGTKTFGSAMMDVLKHIEVEIMDELIGKALKSLAGVLLGMTTGGGTGIFSGIGKLFGFDEGGYVPQDMVAMVHKGEYVIPADVVSSMKSPMPMNASVSSGGGGGFSGGGGQAAASVSSVNFNFLAPISGVTKETITQVATQMVRQLRLGNARI